MPPIPPPNPQLFDQFADQYDCALEKGIAISGEPKEYFARGRVQWLRQCLLKLGTKPREVLDFGCGTGAATPFLMTVPGVLRVTGIDVSESSLAVARNQHGSVNARFLRVGDFIATEKIDLAFCNGVFHHIVPQERDLALQLIWRSLVPNGLFAFWENNPWNPGTRYIMKRIPFDRTANTLSPPVARRLLHHSGFEVLRTDFLFWFPGCLRFLRGLEPALRRCPFGAQYQVLARKHH